MFLLDLHFFTIFDKLKQESERKKNIPKRHFGHKMTIFEPSKNDQKGQNGLFSKIHFLHFLEKFKQKIM